MTIESDIAVFQDIGFPHTAERIERHFKAKAARELAIKRPPGSVQRSRLLEMADKYEQEEKI